MLHERSIEPEVEGNIFISFRKPLVKTKEASHIYWGDSSSFFFTSGKMQKHSQHSTQT